MDNFSISLIEAGEHPFVGFYEVLFFGHPRGYFLFEIDAKDFVHAHKRKDL